MTKLALQLAKLSISTSMEYCTFGAGVPVVYLHGYADSWFSFKAVADLVKGAQNILLTHRGHGGSDKRNANNTINAMAADALQLLDHLRVEKAIFCGHSMGTLIAQEIIGQAPQRVAGVVLVGGAVTADNEVLRGLSAELDGLEYPVERDFVSEFQNSTIKRPVAEAFMNKIIGESLKMPGRLWQPILDALIEYVPDTAMPPGIPTDICWGSEDDIFPIADQDALQAWMPEASFHKYDGSGHGLHWERPEEIAGIISRHVELSVT